MYSAVFFPKEKSRELARCKAELSNAVAVARTAQESLKELESTCQTLDEVSSTFSVC